MTHLLQSPPLYLSDLISHRPPSFPSPTSGLDNRSTPKSLMAPSLTSSRFLFKRHLITKTCPVYPTQNCNALLQFPSLLWWSPKHASPHDG